MEKQLTFHFHSLYYILSFSRLMESFERWCSLSWHRIRSSVPSRKRRYSTPYWHKIVTKKKVRFIYHENGRKRKEIKPEERNADAKPTDNTTGNGKAKISGRFQCQRTIKVGHYSLLNLGPRFQQQTSAERKKNRAKIYGRSSVFLALDWTAFATGDKTIKRLPKQEKK